ncbi:gluconate 2-dehydrogenase subunit 3 family protein [Geomicrobium sp. JCM 19038]|uniref:gluconate 2-dehydrogenase subunit 3 family protein n=1 Tax=Geomicrobium sp. JCM 19038 TaxID=1460635 RepID=UPI00045F2A41|nr:gluconate 2-dehydrogenase subunit 3 family protein [Geomicrobium sp. JCM 19038]GAK09507.1 gluconate 2-dehydrogenase, membrane-bound, gamma subunit [Geomicrobium sp. JCM 19038]
MADEKKPSGLTRREFIKNGSFAVGGLIGGGLIGGMLFNTSSETSTSTSNGDHNHGNGSNDYMEARLFFKRQEDFRVLSSAVERIFPEDEVGPGAIALSVPYFIDRQLAGSWGFNAREYMDGPFEEGEDTQGTQSALLRRDAFLQGVRLIQKEAKANHDGENYFDLTEEQQDAILEKFEAGDVEMNGMSSSQFFSLLRTATLRGVYSDPVYGGNKNMDGWRMKKYPGGQMAYMNIIEDEEFHDMEPISLHEHHN